MTTLRTRLGSRLRDTGIIHVPPVHFTDHQEQQIREVVAPLERRVDALAGALAEALEKLDAQAAAGAATLDAYVKAPPSPQTALDIFQGEWASQLPPPLAGLRAGGMTLFDDPRIHWGIDVLGPVTGQRVLELGPLEGGHTYLLDQLGAREVVAVEANSRAFLKCLVVKELLDISSARFLCGDAVRHLESDLAHGVDPYDFVLASGVLYHLLDPVAALELLTKVTDRLLLWTMHFDPEVAAEDEGFASRFGPGTPHESGGFAHTLYRQQYPGQTLGDRGFCGGSATTSSWMTRADILGALEHFGFEVLDTAFEERTNGGAGSSFLVAARRKGA